MQPFLCQWLTFLNEEEQKTGLFKSKCENVITFRNICLKCEGGGIKFTNGSSCKECSGNLLEICGYPDPPKTWHFDACESFVEFLRCLDELRSPQSV